MSAKPINFTQPDSRFLVEVGRFTTDRTQSFFVFRQPYAPQTAKWRKIPHCNAIFIGNVDDALKGLLSNYKNLELQEMIGLHPSPAATLRKYLGIGYELGKNPKN
ncbi:MAG: hypothetical protein KDE56_29205 [Anaerolineales bacterium]|nr:hypothetical protein [Anaerolineales bacterium]